MIISRWVVKLLFCLYLCLYILCICVCICAFILLSQTHVFSCLSVIVCLSHLSVYTTAGNFI